jgi:hypothetical protein
MNGSKWYIAVTSRVKVVSRKKWLRKLKQLSGLINYTYIRVPDYGYSLKSISGLRKIRNFLSSKWKQLQYNRNFFCG